MVNSLLIQIMRGFPCSSFWVESIATSPDLAGSPSTSCQAILRVTPGQIWKVWQRTKLSSISIENLNRFASVSLLAARSSNNDSCLVNMATDQLTIRMRTELFQFNDQSISFLINTYLGKFIFSFPPPKDYSLSI